MLGAWTQHPGYFLLLSFLIVGFLALMLIYFFKTRTFKHDERMVLLKANRPVIFSFSEKLLRYVPWQFWASSLILVLLIVLFLICSLFKLTDASTTVLEIVKFVTGATIGALFGKNAADSKLSGPSKQLASASEG